MSKYKTYMPGEYIYIYIYMQPILGYISFQPTLDFH